MRWARARWSPALASLPGRALAQAAPYRAHGVRFPVRRQRRQQHGRALRRLRQLRGRPSERRQRRGARERRAAPIAPSNLTRKFGLHPQLAPLVPLFEQRKLAVVCNTGTLVAPDHQGATTRQPTIARATCSRTATSISRPRRDSRRADAQRLGRPLDRRRRRGQCGRRRARHGVARRRCALHHRRHVVAGGAVAVWLARPQRGSDIADWNHPPAGDDADPRRGSRQRARRAGAGGDGACGAQQRSARRRADGCERRDRRCVRRCQQRTRRPALPGGEAHRRARSLGVARQGFFYVDGRVRHAQRAAQRPGEPVQRAGACARRIPARARRARGGRPGHDVHAVRLQPHVPHQRQCRHRSRVGRSAAGDGRRGEGRRVLRKFPDLTMGGPDDASDYGAWIPTTSFDQYGATIARWFGVPAASLASVFPALAAFPSADVGFLG